MSAYLDTPEAIAARLAGLTYEQRKGALEQILASRTDLAGLRRNAHLMTLLRQRGLWPPS